MMELSQILAGKTTAGSPCDIIEGGIEEVYLVPATDNVSWYRKPFHILQFPDIAAIPVKIDLEMEAAQFRSNQKNNIFENVLSFKCIRQVADWLYKNRNRKFRLLLNLGKEWIISGDSDLPYTLEMDYDSSRTMQDAASFSVELKSRQPRPYHKWRNANFTLNSTDWSLKSQYKGTWISNTGLVNNDHVLYLGKIYRVQPTELLNPTGVPGTSPDFVLIGDYKGAWQQSGVYAIGDCVLLAGQIYSNTNGQNRYTISFN
jgi:hypothetical protein